MATQPTSRPITQIYGARPDYYKQFGLPGHEGLDYGPKCGTPVVSAIAGTVASVTRHPQYGNYVTVSHGGGRSTGYAHLLSTTVVPGQAVSEGQRIGSVGSTGNSTGCHLHFNYIVNGKFTNPEQLFQGQDMGIPEKAYNEAIAANQAASRKARRNLIGQVYLLWLGRPPTNKEVDARQDQDPDYIIKDVKSSPESKAFNPSGVGETKNSIPTERVEPVVERLKNYLNDQLSKFK